LGCEALDYPVVNGLLFLQLLEVDVESQLVPPIIACQTFFVKVVGRLIDVTLDILDFDKGPFVFLLETQTRAMPPTRREMVFSKYFVGMSP
jgi:hypothetical protein